MRFIFVRHGESVGNVEGRFQGLADEPLTELGLEQARRVAATLAGSGPVAAVYASPLRRAADTAAEIGRALGVTPEVEPDLRELDCGVATGLTWVEFSGRYPEAAARAMASRDGQDVDDLWPGGEKVSAFRSRCWAAVDRIAARHPTGTVVVVAHGGSIGWALAHLLDPEEDAWPTHHLPNASIAEVLIEGGRAAAVRIGDVRHLTRDAGAPSPFTRPLGRGIISQA